MAQDKTEKPTPKRLQDARERGQVAKSQDFNGAVVLTTATLMMGYVGTYTLSTLYGLMEQSFSHLPTKPLTLIAFTSLWQDTLGSLTTLLLPLLLGSMILAILSNLVQVKPLFSIQAIHPKLDKINPLSGFKRLWSMRAIVEVVKAIVKMTIIGLCGYFIIQNHLSQMMMLGMTDPMTAWSTIFGVLSEIAVWSCSWFFLLGLIDWRYQAYELEKQLRMSRQEIKDEHKNQEGDPMMKNRIRQMGLQIARNRQLASVPTADVIITNPTHYAIAIKYDPDIAPAPVVVAKGVDHFAQKIKEVAKANDVPMVENRPLARSLHAAVEVEAMIPPDLFIAVAEVLAFVFSTNKGRRLQAQKRAEAFKKKKQPRVVAPALGEPDLADLDELPSGYDEL